jgi:hypothetical protein
VFERMNIYYIEKTKVIMAAAEAAVMAKVFLIVLMEVLHMEIA